MAKIKLKKQVPGIERIQVKQQDLLFRKIAIIGCE